MHYTFSWLWWVAIVLMVVVDLALYATLFADMRAIPKFFAAWAVNIVIIILFQFVFYAIYGGI